MAVRVPMVEGSRWDAPEIVSNAHVTAAPKPACDFTPQSDFSSGPEVAPPPRVTTASSREHGLHFSVLPVAFVSAFQSPWVRSSRSLPSLQWACVTRRGAPGSWRQQWMGLVWESCAVTGQGGAASPGLPGHSVQRGSSSGVICFFFFKVSQPPNYSEVGSLFNNRNARHESHA